MENNEIRVVGSIGELMRPDPEVREDVARRKFTAQYKLDILKRVEQCRDPGEIGALLRKEGLYSSNLTTWKRQREAGVLAALSPRQRGRKKVKVNPLAQKVAQLERENERLQKKLKRAEAIIEVQKKISEILGIPQDPSAESSL